MTLMIYIDDVCGLCLGKTLLGSCLEMVWYDMVCSVVGPTSFEARCLGGIDPD